MASLQLHQNAVFIPDPRTVTSQLGKKGLVLVSHFLALNIKNKSQFFAKICLTL